jgi:hypothetical protein
MRAGTVQSVVETVPRPYGDAGPSGGRNRSITSWPCGATRLDVRSIAFNLDRKGMVPASDNKTAPSTTLTDYSRHGIERSRWRGIEVVAAIGVPAASSSAVGALGRNRPVQSDQR